MKVSADKTETFVDFGQHAQCILKMVMVVDAQCIGNTYEIQYVIIIKAFVPRGLILRTRVAHNVKPVHRDAFWKSIWNNICSTAYLEDVQFDVSFPVFLGQPNDKAMFVGGNKLEECSAKWRDAVTLHLVSRLNDAFEDTAWVKPRVMSHLPVGIINIVACKKMTITRVWSVVSKQGPPFWWVW